MAGGLPHPLVGSSLQQTGYDFCPWLHRRLQDQLSCSKSNQTHKPNKAKYRSTRATSFFKYAPKQLRKDAPQHKFSLNFLEWIKPQNKHRPTHWGREKLNCPWNLSPPILQCSARNVQGFAAPCKKKITQGKYLKPPNISSFQRTDRLHVASLEFVASYQSWTRIRNHSILIPPAGGR